MRTARPARTEPRMTADAQDTKRAELIAAGYTPAKDVPISDARVKVGSVLEFGSPALVYFVEVGTIEPHATKPTVTITSADFDRGQRAFDDQGQPIMEPDTESEVEGVVRQVWERKGAGSRHTFEGGFVFRRVWSRA